MKFNLIPIIAFLGLGLFGSNQLSGQVTDTIVDEDIVETPIAKPQLKRVLKNDGNSYTGIILEDSPREILLQTEAIGKIYIPKHEIASIETVVEAEGGIAKELGEDLFATRYVFTTNGLPLRKGDSYALLNLWGPDVQYAVADNFSVGIISTWLASPLILSVKKSITLDKKNSLAVGALAGIPGSISLFNGNGGLFNGFAGAVLPFAGYTRGGRASNFTVSGGYAYVGVSGSGGAGAAMFSIAGLHKISKRTSFVFDSMFFIPKGGESVMLFMPGLRFNSRKRMYERAFGFSLSIFAVPSQDISIPLPTFYWYYRL